MLCTPRNLAVPPVAVALRLPNESGLIVDRPFTPKTTVANGRSFTSASAALPGGHGAAIVLLQNWQTGNAKFPHRPGVGLTHSMSILGSGIPRSEPTNIRHNFGTMKVSVRCDRSCKNLSHLSNYRIITRKPHQIRLCPARLSSNLKAAQTSL